MTDDGPSPTRLGPPIAVRLVSLLIIGWALTLLITAAVVLLLPPPPTPVYRLSEIYGALKGGSLSSRDGRPMVRVRQPEPPQKGFARMTSGIYRLALASSLDLPPQRVRFERYPIADPVRRALLRALSAAPPVASGPPGSMVSPYFMPPVTAAMADAPQQRPQPVPSLNVSPTTAQTDGQRWRAFPLDSYPPVVGEFSAAIQDPSGGWVVVRPAPEIFPNPWQQRMILWFLACFSILTPIGYVFARRITAPVGLFARAAERLGRDPSAPAIELSGPAEIGRAAAAFNEMQARLKRYVEHRTEMIGAVAHDLRTPLTRIRFKIEGLPPETRDSIKRDIVQMEQMISAALAFVREASEVRPRELLDLGSALECVVDSTSLTGADVRIVSSQPLVVQADGLGLERLFSNLIGNAVKYGRRARVKVFQDKRSAVVEICDSGPGLPASELERVFEPFYRVEPSRSPETGGMGLGLAVARSIARAHGGDIELINGRHGGLVARVQLPLPPSAPPRPSPTKAAAEPVV